MSSSFFTRRLAPGDVSTARRLNALFAEVFGESEKYSSRPPSDAYLTDLLRNAQLIALVAEVDGEPVGGLVAYVLGKLEQQRSEIYIYDLAVAESFRRRGIATALIDELRSVAMSSSAWVIYVQADYGDEAAIALYEKLGTREDVMHFDIAPAATK
jgi:aminoglycoside 3-N-acetyltransferase I